MRVLPLALAGFVFLVSCGRAPVEPDIEPQPFFRIWVAAVPDSVSLGDSVLVRWSVTNVGTAPGAVRGFFLGANAIRDLTGLQPHGLFCGIGPCELLLNPGEEAVAEDWWIPQGTLAKTAVAIVTVTYTAPGALLQGFDHVWVSP